MKKLARIVLVIVLLAAWTGVSLADVYASYSDGKLTVSTDEKGFWEISVDNEWIGYYLGSALPSTAIPMTLEEGEHTVTITNPDENRNLTVAVWVGENGSGGAAQPAASDGPMRLESARYEKGVVMFRLSGLRDSAEIWLDGRNTGAGVAENGEASLLQVLPEGEHTLALIAADGDETDSKSFFAASFCPDAETLRPTLTDLVKNEAGETLASGLAIDRDEESYLLRVSVDGKPDAALTIGKNQLQSMLDQGLNVIEYVNGKAALRVDLTRITDQWFDTAEPVTAYVFSLKAQESGARATVAALTPNETVEARALSGVMLIQNGERAAVNVGSMD